MDIEKVNSMELRPKDSTQKMQTLSECIDAAQNDGFSENFKIDANMLWTEDRKTVYRPEQIAIENFYRFEGYSDPADNSILYLIAAYDGRKGILIDAYDAYADAAVSKFIKRVEEIEKKPPHADIDDQ